MSGQIIDCEKLYGQVIEVDNLSGQGVDLHYLSGQIIEVDNLSGQVIELRKSFTDCSSCVENISEYLIAMLVWF